MPAAGPRAAGSSPSATRERSGTPKSDNNHKFPKTRRLRKRAEFRRVYDEGKRIQSSSFAMFYLARDGSADGPRAGFTTPRALGKANVRNRLRRRMREAVRREIGKLTAPIDLVFHPRRPVLTVPLPALLEEVEKALRRVS